MVWWIVCESSELAVECAHAAEAIGLKISIEISSDWYEDAMRYVSKGHSAAIALVEPPELARVVNLSKEALAKKQSLAFAVVGDGIETKRVLDAASDIGVVGLSEIKPLIVVLALLNAQVVAPWACSLRALSAADRARLRCAVGHGARTRGQLIREKDGIIAWSSDVESDSLLLGETRDVAVAIAALRVADGSGINIASAVENVDEQAVLNVIFGPRRSLSDPASKAALLAYGLTMPVEELCSSASRAAAEASRIGYPVRLALASPDLRIWDHPDLAADQIDNAARVREVFGLLTALAKSRSPESRLLGVTVAASNQAVALLEVRAMPLSQGRYSKLALPTRMGKLQGTLQ